MLTEKTFDTGTVTINYAEGPPNGKPLVMLHGITCWWQTFLPVLPGLMVRYHTYALDQRGHGRSSRSPGAYYLRNYAEDTVAFLRNQVTEPAFLLGWSLGSMVSLVAAASAPELIRAIILEDPPLNELVREPNEEKVADVVKRFKARRHRITMGGSRQDRLSELAAGMPGADNAKLRNKLKQLELCDPETVTFVIERKYAEGIVLEDMLPKLNCPVLLLKASPDATLSANEADLAESLLPDATQVAIQDVGHDIHTGDPTTFTRVVSDFLESC